MQQVQFSLLSMGLFLSLLSLAFAINNVLSFPSYGSLAGLSSEELDRIIPTLQTRGFEPEPPPGPLNDTLTKLVNDEDHPWKTLQPGDIRGPCPGLNTLASHGVC
jgi:unspecific peroxygenase